MAAKALQLVPRKQDHVPVVGHDTDLDLLLQPGQAKYMLIQAKRDCFLQSAIRFYSTKKSLITFTLSYEHKFKADNIRFFGGNTVLELYSECTNL